MIVGLGEVVKDGLGLKIEHGTMALEHRFFRGPRPGFASAPLGLLCAGHDTSCHLFQPSVVGLHEVNPS